MIGVWVIARLVKMNLAFQVLMPDQILLHEFGVYDFPGLREAPFAVARKGTRCVKQAMRLGRLRALSFNISHLGPSPQIGMEYDVGGTGKNEADQVIDFFQQSMD
jgi:hypothetical protein